MQKAERWCKREESVRLRVKGWHSWDIEKFLPQEHNGCLMEPEMRVGHTTVTVGGLWGQVVIVLDGGGREG